jgi:hypothetical protein
VSEATPAPPGPAPDRNTDPAQQRTTGYHHPGHRLRLLPDTCDPVHVVIGTLQVAQAIPVGTDGRFTTDVQVPGTVRPGQVAVIASQRDTTGTEQTGRTVFTVTISAPAPTRIPPRPAPRHRSAAPTSPYQPGRLTAGHILDDRRPVKRRRRTAQDASATANDLPAAALGTAVALVSSAAASCTGDGAQPDRSGRIAATPGVLSR